MLVTKTIAQHLDARAELYKRLATTSSSIEELLMKVELLGEKWTRWDWATMLQYIVSHYVMNCYHESEVNSIGALFKAICKCVESSDLLDNILTDKEVMLAMIAHTKQCTEQFFVNFADHSGTSLDLIAIVLKKFPSMWNMSWMWSKCWKKTRCGKKFYRKHRLQFLFPEKDEKFFMSKAYYEAFIAKFNHLDSSGA